MSRRVMLIVPPHAGRAVWEFPLGVGYLANQLKRGGFEPVVLDINGLQLSREQVLDRLKSADCSLFGISAFSTQFSYAAWLAEAIKALDPANFVAIGGPLPTHQHEITLRHTRVDVCAIGEADRTIADIFANPGHPEGIPGLAWRDGEEIRKNPAPEPFDLDDLEPHPYHLFPEEVYFKRIGKGVNMATTRGCPFHCNFCSKTVPHVRKRSQAHLEAELSTLKARYGLRGVQFSDELAITNSQRGYELCEMLARLKLNWGCQARVDLVDYPLLRHMRACGCTSLAAGVESGSQRILAAMNKKTTVEQNEAFMVNCMRAGIMPWVQFIFGYPGEDEESVAASVDLFRRANYTPPRPDFVGQYIMSSVATPLPGSTLYNDLVASGAISDELAYLRRIERGYYVLKPEDIIFNLTAWSNEELMARKTAMETAIWQNWRRRANRPLARLTRVLRALPKGRAKAWQALKPIPDRSVVPEVLF